MVSIPLVLDPCKRPSNPRPITIVPLLIPDDDGHQPSADKDSDEQELERLQGLDQSAIAEYEAIKEKMDQCVFAALAGGKSLDEAKAIAEEYLGERKAHAWDGVQHFGKAVAEKKATMRESISCLPRREKRRWVL